jgi:hypothetical protein
VARIERKVEVLKGASIAEVGGFAAATNLSLMAHINLVLEQDLQELNMLELVGFGFLKTQIKGIKQS